MKSLIEQYGAYLRKQKLSHNTEISYLKDIEAFLESIEAKTKRDVLRVKAVAADGYIDRQKAMGRANSSISRSVSALKKFYGYLTENAYIKKNPFIGIDIPRVEKKVPQSLTAREVVKLLSQPQKTDLKGYRDHAMLELLYATGMKVSEIISLRVRDVDIAGQMVHITGKHQRYIPIGNAAAESLDEYIKKAYPLMVKRASVRELFLNYNGTALTRQGFWKILKKYAAAAGIKKELNAQTLRNSFAVHMLQNGADINSVSQMLGHEDVATTRSYNAALQDNIIKIYKKAHPRA